MIYVPKPVLDLLAEVKGREKVKKNVDAWNKLGFLAGVGMNMEDFLGVRAPPKRKRGLL